jgi:hypothetical protein
LLETCIVSIANAIKKKRQDYSLTKNGYKK